MTTSRRNAALTEERHFVRSAYLERLAPVALSVLLVQLCSIINNLVVGRMIGSDGLAVMSSVNPVYFICATLGALLGTGGSTVAARRIGQDDPEGANRAFTASVLCIFIAGALVTALGLILREPLLRLLGTPERLRPLAAEYLNAYLPGAIGVMGVYIPFNYLKLAGRQNASLLVFLLMAAINVGLDLLLAPSMGMLGIGMATSAGAWAAMLLGLLLLCGRGGAFRLRARGASPLGQIARFGSPAAVNNLCNVLRVLLLNHVIISALGSPGLTAFSLIATTYSFSMSISNGTSLTMAPFAAVFSGERDSESLRQLLRCSLLSGLALMLVYAGLIAAFPASVCALFSVTEPEALASAIPALRAFALSLPLCVVNFNMIAFYANGGRTLLSNAMTIGRSLALVVAFALLLARVIGGAALWYAFPLSELGALAGGLCYALVYSRGRAHTSRLALIDTLAEDEGRYIAFSVEPTDAAAASSAEKITAFCEQNELPPKTTMALGLAIEELLLILNHHALEGGARGHLRDSSVRVLIYQQGSVILRFRCAGRAFDPIKAAEGEDEGQEYLGVRLIRKLAKSVSYTHTLGINNLTILL